MSPRTSYPDDVRSETPIDCPHEIAARLRLSPFDLLTIGNRKRLYLMAHYQEPTPASSARPHYYSDRRPNGPIVETPS